MGLLANIKQLGLAILVCAGACTSKSHPEIDLDRIRPEESIVGPYTYFVPPYSTYYFHHMDQLGFRLDWVRRSGPVY